MQMQEILDDLRKGSLSMQIHEPGLRAAADTVGRRIFSGLVVAGLLMGGAFLIAQDDPWVGVVFVVAALFWASLHSVVVAWLARRRKRQW